MFEIPKKIQALWHEQAKQELENGSPKIKRFETSELEKLENLYSHKLPDDYIDFHAQYGAIYFYDSQASDSDEIPDIASTTLDGQNFDVDIAQLFDAKTIDYHLQRLVLDPDNDFKQPLIPMQMLPIAGDIDYNLFLLDPKTGEVWYWWYSSDPWATEQNSQLGHVATNFTAFINSIVKR